MADGGQFIREAVLENRHFSFFQSGKGYALADKALTKIMEVFILEINSSEVSNIVSCSI